MEKKEWIYHGKWVYKGEETDKEISERNREWKRGNKGSKGEFKREVFKEKRMTWNGSSIQEVDSRRFSEQRGKKELEIRKGIKGGRHKNILGEWNHDRRRGIWREV